MGAKWFGLVVLVVLAAACGRGEQYTAAPSRQEPSLPLQVSGVWRASRDGAMVSFVYSQSKFQMLVGDDAIPLTVGDMDQTNKTVNLNIVRTDGKPGPWTVRQVWDSQSKSFHLMLTLHNGTQDQLSFVRRISTDDLNTLAAAYAKSGREEISSAIQSVAVSTTPSAQPSTTRPAAPEPESRPTPAFRDAGQESPERSITRPVQPSASTTAHEYVQLMIGHAMYEGLVDTEANILEAKGRIEAFDLKSTVVQRQRKTPERPM